MAEAFAGTWILTSSENFDEYMKAVGVGFTTRQLASILKPTTEITVEGNKLIIATHSTFKNTKLICTLDEEFDEVTADDRKVKSIVKLINNKLVHHQKWDGKETILTRELKDNKLYLTLVIGEVTCTRIYEKQ